MKKNRNTFSFALAFMFIAISKIALAADAGCDRLRQQFIDFGGSSPGALEAQCTSQGGFINRAITISLGLAGSVAALFIIIGAIRYLTSAGNPTNQAAAKKTITWAAVGLIVVTLSYTIVRLVTNLVLKNGIGF